MAEIVYCQSCGWSGVPASDKCPSCQRMGHFMKKPSEQIKKTALARKTTMPATA